MQDEPNISLIIALAAGCDPETGEEFEPTHVLRRKEVTKALNSALKAMGGKAAKRPRRPIMKTDHFDGELYNRISARSRKELAERILGLPMTYPLDKASSRIVRTVDARSQEPWKRTEQEMLSRVLPHTNDLKFLSIVFQRSENALRTEARRLMAERKDLRELLAGAVVQNVVASLDHEQPVTKKKAYSVDEKRKLHPNAYAPWNEADDANLERLWREGSSRKELSLVFGRDPKAISSRIRKLELNE